MRALSMSRMLAILARMHDCQFAINGQIEPGVLIFSPEMFLPVVALHADMAATSALGHGLGLEYERDEQGMFGIGVKVAPLTGDEISLLRAVFFAHAAQQIFGYAAQAQGQTIECAPVFEAYVNGLAQHVDRHGELKWPLAIRSPH